MWREWWRQGETGTGRARALCFPDCSQRKYVRARTLFRSTIIIINRGKLRAINLIFSAETNFTVIVPSIIFTYPFRVIDFFPIPLHHHHHCHRQRRRRFVP